MATRRYVDILTPESVFGVNIRQFTVNTHIFARMHGFLCSYMECYAHIWNYGILCMYVSDEKGAANVASDGFNFNFNFNI